MTIQEIASPDVRFLNDSCAVVTYEVSEEIEIENQVYQIDVVDSSTWVKKEGQWICVLHTESITRH